MFRKQFLLIYYCCALKICNGAIWKTEEAYIIDDLPDNDPAVADNVSDACTDSTGAQGQCVSMSECNGYYNFFISQDKESKGEILTGLQRYLNGTDLEACTPTTDAIVNETYVCCTSLKYTNVQNISWNDYNSKNANPMLEESLPEIKQAGIYDEIVPNIVAGQETRKGEFPFAVAIMYRGQQICGGSLIDSAWVLSAAHCFDRFNSQAVRQLVIKVGDHDISRIGETSYSHQDILVAKLFLHPGFFRDRGYFKDDVALIKLKSPVSPSPNVGTVSLHNGSPNINSGFVQATVCGWGKTCDGCSQSSVLRKTTVSLLDLSQCSQRYAGTAAPPITQNMVCAGGQRADACNGDSGGPLVMIQSGRVYQIGIVSWGIGCGKYPGVYTRVSSFGSWIAKHKQKG